MLCVVSLAAPSLLADKLSFDERVEITRGLTAEFAKSKIIVPRSKKPLPYSSDGHYDEETWKKVLYDQGPAVRVGDQVQITRVQIETKKILLEINGGTKSGRHWYDRVEVGMGGSTAPINRNGSYGAAAAAGSNIALEFPDGVPSVTSAEIKTMLAPLFDFSKHSATQNYVDSLPAPVKKAIQEKKPIQGMNKEEVMLALGHPRNKSRETQDGDEYEDWVYGNPPGKMVFVRFSEGKVVKVTENYANVGGSTAPPLPVNP